MPKDNTSIALIKKDISYIKESIDRIEENIKCQGKIFVSKIEFDLVNKEQNNRIDKIEKLVMGATVLALTTLGKALLDLVVRVKAGI
jgi:hypothetical protein